MKLEPDVSTVYKYIHALSTKIVTPTIIDPFDVKSISNNMNKVLPSFLSKVTLNQIFGITINS